MIFELKPLAPEDIKTLLRRAVTDPVKGLGSYHPVLEPEAADFLADISGGDARSALNALELGVLTTKPGRMGKSILIWKLPPTVSRSGWCGTTRAGMSTMTRFPPLSRVCGALTRTRRCTTWQSCSAPGRTSSSIARRIMICASEDVGNADPRALTVAVSAAQAVERVGMPEAQIILAQAVTYVASAPKSNAACTAVFEAIGVSAECKNHSSGPSERRPL